MFHHIVPMISTSIAPILFSNFNQIMELLYNRHWCHVYVSFFQCHIIKFPRTVTIAFIILLLYGGLICHAFILCINDKGTLNNGKIVAVKKLAIGKSPKVKADFESEVKLISNVHHRNMIRLLGCCSKGPE